MLLLPPPPKNISIPPDLQGTIIGLFWGLITGLFFYQQYRRPYYWWYSLGLGLLTAVIVPRIFAKIYHLSSSDLSFVMLQIITPAIPCLLLNLSLRKNKRRKKSHRGRSHSKSHSRKSSSDIFAGPPEQQKK